MNLLQELKIKYNAQLISVVTAGVFKPETLKWMDNFFDDTNLDRYYESKRKASPQVIEELKPFRPRSSVTIYRGLYWPSEEDYELAPNKMTSTVPMAGDVITYKDRYFSSWTTSYEAAHGYAKSADPDGLHIVMRMNVSPKFVLLDTDQLSQEVLDLFHYKTGTFKESREIVVYPSSYKTTVCSVDWTDEDGEWQDDSLPEYDDY